MEEIARAAANATPGPNSVATAASGGGGGTSDASNGAAPPPATLDSTSPLRPTGMQSQHQQHPPGLSRTVSVKTAAS